MKILLTIFNVLACTLMVAVAALFVAPLLPFENNIELRIVESGSMEPSIMTGAVVLIVPQSEYSVGDVITFSDSSAKVPTTHRIVEMYKEKGSTWFVTKGDANEEADTAAVAARDIYGSVMFDIPYAGYILDFSRHPVGFFFLIVIPALLIIFGEIEKIWSELRQKKDDASGGKEKSDKPVKQPEAVETKVSLAVISQPNRMIDIATPVRYQSTQTENSDVVSLHPKTPEKSFSVRERISPWYTAGVGVFLAVVIIGINYLPTTISFPNDLETSPVNELSAATLDFTVLPDGEIYSFVDGVLSGDDDGALVSVVAPEAGSLEVRYAITVEETGGNPLFCAAINASADSPFNFDGPLTALSYEDVTFVAPWSLSLTLSDDEGLIDGDTCSVDIIYTAWYYNSLTDQGYFDEERTPLSFIFVAEQTSFQTASFAPLSLRVNESQEGGSEGGEAVDTEPDKEVASESEEAESVEGEGEGDEETTEEESVIEEDSEGSVTDDVEGSSDNEEETQEEESDETGVEETTEEEVAEVEEENKEEVFEEESEVKEEETETPASEEEQKDEEPEEKSEPEEQEPAEPVSTEESQSESVV